MATKSILKNVTIKGKKNCLMFANALENASKKVGKEVYYSLSDSHVKEIIEVGKEHVLEE